MLNQGSVARRLALLVSLLALVDGAAAADLYPYESHAQLPPGDEEIGTVSLTTPFLFFEQEYTELMVNANTFCVYYGSVESKP